MALKPHPEYYVLIACARGVMCAGVWESQMSAPRNTRYMQAFPQPMGASTNY